MKYILLDTQNLIHRSKHITRGDAFMKSGLALHVVFTSILKCWRQFEADHVVVALEGRSWRKAVYAPYKAHRQVKDNLKSDREKEDDEIFFEVMNDFIDFISKKTNCTVLQSVGCEADDFIARWTQLHPNDEHVIISSDTDFHQLLSPNVSIYNGITQHHIRIDGVYDDKGEPVENKKTKKHQVFDPEWELFKKCMKGDPGDGVFVAHVPRTRETKIRQAYDDRNAKGYAWNNLVLEEWEDHEGVKDSVINRYHRNVGLIDLTAQPQEIIDLMDAVIDAAKQVPRQSQVGIWFLKFCEKHALTRIQKDPTAYADYLNAPLPEQVVS